MKKPSRTVSGVAPVAIMWTGSCPGECIYCPTVVGVPKSYTGKEPAARRALRNNLDAYSQVKNRVAHLEKNGHSTEKIDLIIMGGTFEAATKQVQMKFVKDAIDALNGFKSESLEDALKKNETAKRRMIGLTIETRPDFCDPDWLLSLGATKVELGVQSLSDDVLKWVKRGHGVRETVDATKRLKDAGFKICYHIMPGLGEDEKTLKLLFSDEKFKPDMLKIYPVLLIPGTELYKMYEKGEYKPPKIDETVKLLADFKETVPKYVRIIRIQRDIPATEIGAGIKKGNLRQIIWDELRRRGKKCHCIRCREAGRVEVKGEPKLNILEYKASDGREFFISFETENAIIGFLRLRLSDVGAYVREIHVYGQALGLGEDAGKDSFQHQGYGKKLLFKAEEIAKKEGFEKLKVISGIGAREYYKNHGYKLRDYYMEKIF